MAAEYTPADLTDLTDLTPAEAEVALELTARGFKIVDFSTEPADENE